MTEKHSPLMPCPFCGMPMTLQGDYTEETAWNFWCHADRDAPEVSTCILKDHQINTARDMRTPDHNETIAWNTRAVNGLPEAIAALEEMLTDPPATLDEPDTDAEVIIKMREIVRAALTKLKG